MATPPDKTKIPAEAREGLPQRPPRPLRVLAVPVIEAIEWNQQDPMAWSRQVKDATASLVHDAVNCLQAALDLYVSVGQTADKPAENLRYGILAIWGSWVAFAKTSELDKEGFMASPVFNDVLRDLLTHFRKPYRGGGRQEAETMARLKHRLEIVRGKFQELRGVIRDSMARFSKVKKGSGPESAPKRATAPERISEGYSASRKTGMQSGSSSRLEGSRTMEVDHGRRSSPKQTLASSKNGTMADEDSPLMFDPIHKRDFWDIRGIQSTSAFAQEYERRIVPQLMEYLQPLSRRIVIVAFNLRDRKDGMTLDTPVIFVGVDKPTALRGPGCEERLRGICGGNGWSDPAIGVFDVCLGKEVESASPTPYSEMKQVHKPLEGYYQPENRTLILMDEQLYHEKIGLGCSIGAHPEIKDRHSTSSHGMFLKGTQSGDIYGLSTGHGFGNTKKSPEIIGRNIVSPSFSDLQRVQRVMEQILCGHQEREMSLAKSSDANPKDVGLSQSLSRARIQLKQLTQLQSDTTRLRTDVQLATFATLELGCREAVTATDIHGVPLKGGGFYELMDFALYKLAEKSRFAGNFALSTPHENMLPLNNLQLDADVTMNSRTLGETNGVISGIGLYEYTDEENDEFKGKTMRHWFVMIDPTKVAVEDKVGNVKGVILSAPGSSGGIWADKYDTKALALHRSSRKIPAPAIFLDSQGRQNLLDKVKSRRGKIGEANEGELVWKDFPKQNEKWFCEVAVISNLKTVLRHAAANGIILEDLSLENTSNVK